MRAVRVPRRSMRARRSAPNTCSYAACQVRTCTSAIGGGVFEPRAPDVHRPTCRRCRRRTSPRRRSARCVSLPLNAGMTPPPFSTWCCAIGERRLQLVEVRPDRARRGRRRERVAARAVRGEDRLPVGALLRRRLRVRAGGQRRRSPRRRPRPCRSRGSWASAATPRRIWSRTTFSIVLCLKPCALRAGEGVVEVRADGALRTRGREHVAAGALRREELLAVRQVGARRGLAARAAATREERGGSKQCPWKRAAQHYAGGWFPVVPSVATASSRVG